MNSRPLFAYGTFRDARWRRAILAHDYPVRAAVLPGYRRAAVEQSGYLTIVASPYDVVDGLLIELDAYGWRVADAWEEVPAYLPADVEARDERGAVAAAAYVASNVAGRVRPVENDRLLATVTDAEVERAIAAFRSANAWIRGRWELLLYRGDTYVGGRRYEDEAEARSAGAAAVREPGAAAAPPTDLLRAIDPPPDRYVVRFDGDPSRPAP